MKTTSEDRLDLRPLQRAFTSATEQASVAVQRWTGGRVTLTLDEHREVPLEHCMSALEVGSDPYAMVILELAGGASGQFILLFDDVDGRQLAAGLLGRQLVDESDWSELEKSAVMETGNIIASAYLNALTDLSGASLIPSPPTFIRDYGSSVIQQAMMCQALHSDRVLVCRTRFHYDQQQMNWNVFFLPGEELQQKLLLGVHSSASL